MLEDNDYDPPLYRNLLLKEQADLLIKELNKLSQSELNIIVAALNGVGVSEYADLTGRHPGTTKQLYALGCRKLKKALKSYT